MHRGSHRPPGDCASVDTDIILLMVTQYLLHHLSSYGSSDLPQMCVVRACSCVFLCVHDCVGGVYSLKTLPGVCARTHVSRLVNCISTTKEGGETGVRSGSLPRCPSGGAV